MTGAFDGKPRFVITGLAWWVGLYFGFTAAWRALDGDAGEALWRAAAAVLALGTSALSFRREAARAVGPAGSPERRQRRLPPARVVREAAVAVLVAGAVAAAYLGLADTDDRDVAQVARMAPFIGTLFATQRLWWAWWSEGEGARPAEAPTSTAGRALVRVRRLLNEPYDIRWPRRHR